MDVQAYRRAGLAQDCNGALGALIGGLRAMGARVEDWSRRRAAYAETLAELSGLSDRDLADLGFSRADLRAIARDAAVRA